MTLNGKLSSLLRDYAVITAACFIFAICWECFMIPNGMSSGGMMGLSTIIQYATGGFLPAQYTYLAINAVLVIVAVLALGIGFGFKTIYSIIMSSVAMTVIGSIEAIHCIPGMFFYVEETLLIPIIAGFFEALGIGLIIRFGGSTGGTDIVALMVNKYWPVSLSTTFLISDLIICSLLLFLPDKNFSDMCYGLLELVTFSLVIDTVVGGNRSSYQLMIFSNQYDKIADYVIKELDRGATCLKAQGWYTKADKPVLMIIISKKQLPSISKEIKRIDSKAFMTVSPVGSVYGEGFDEIKAGVAKKNE